MSLKTQIVQDAALFLNPGEFAEAVTYTPKNGTPKAVAAVIDRKRISPSAEDVGRVLANQCEIYLSRDAVSGIPSVNKGGDTISFPENIGGLSINWAVIDIIGQDEGIWHLLVQK